MEDPGHERALLENDICSQEHIRLERHDLAVGVNIRPVESGRDPDKQAL